MKVPLAFPSIDQKDIENVCKVLQSGQLIQGSHVQHLEKAVAALVGVEYAVVVSSGTATLHLALLSLGVGPGDEVVIPAFSYVATANVIELVGAKPVFVDIHLDTFNIRKSWARLIQKIYEVDPLCLPEMSGGHADHQIHRRCGGH